MRSLKRPKALARRASEGKPRRLSTTPRALPSLALRACVIDQMAARRRRRRGSAAVDYFLVVGVVLPLPAFVLWIGPRAMQSVYDLLTIVVAWPFL